MSKLKVLTIVGTRPELIRLSVIIRQFDKYFSHFLVHTGQNYDYELNEIFFKDLDIREPDYYLNVNTHSLGSVIGDTIIKTEEILIKIQPDAILVLGDTNSSLSAIIAKRMHVPVFHMEAGNRSFDMNVPEEINRRIIDHIADINLVYTDNARNHLLSEGISHRRIYLTGSPLVEVLKFYHNKILSSNVLSDLGLNPKKYFVVSVHREENVDNQENLKAIINILNGLVDKYSLPIIFSAHPRTMNRLNNAKNLKIHENIKLIKPLGYCDYIKLQSESYCTISDSGTISEESAILNFPAITIRESMERPEAIDAGTILLAGLDADIVSSAIDLVTSESNSGGYTNIPEDYTISNTSMRVLKIIVGLTRLSNKWWGISSNN